MPLSKQQIMLGSLSAAAKRERGPKRIEWKGRTDQCQVRVTIPPHHVADKLCRAVVIGMRDAFEGNLIQATPVCERHMNQRTPITARVGRVRPWAEFQD